MRSNQRPRESIGCNLNKSISLLKKRVNSEQEINGNKQCKKEDNKEMQEVGEKKSTQKAFLCSTLMKSYAFVIMLLPCLLSRAML